MRAGLLGVAGLAMAAFAPVPAGGPGLKALAGIERGAWQLRSSDRDEPARNLCIADPDVLIQLRHPGAQCRRLVLTDDPRVATVQYSCAGTGRGRTTITVETGRLFHIETQGLVGGAPFDVDYEARRIGACGASAH